MTGQGGWPMTVVCTPDGRPFFAGTYFPKERRGGMIGFVELCERIDELWHTQRDDLLEQADQLTGAARSLGARRARRRACPTAEDVDARRRPARRGHRPRVRRPRRRPQVPAADGAWRPWPSRPAAGRPQAARARSPSPSTPWPRAGSTTTSAVASPATPSTACGWCPTSRRCSTTTPCSSASTSTAGCSPARTGSARCSAETIDYVLRDLRQPGGGTSSAEDADSEGVEGKFYVWTDTRGARGARRGRRRRPPLVRVPARRELRARHDDPEPDARARRAGPPAGGRGGAPGAVRGAGRAGPPGARRQGAHRVERLPRRRAGRGRGGRPASAAGSTPRSRRPSSCSPTCAAPTVAGCAPGRPTPAPGTSPTPPTTAPSSTRSPGWPRPPARPAGSPRPAPRPTRCSTSFWDDERGGVFTTGHDAEALIARPKDLMDNATPGANGLAAVGLLRLAALTGDARYREHGEADRPPPRRAWPSSTRPRSATCSRPSTSSPAAPPRSSWPATARTCSRSLRRPSARRAVLAWGERYDSPLWEGRDDGRAYVCQGYACQLPAATSRRWSPARSA